MDWKAKKVLIIDLSKKESEIKSYPDLNKFIGGVGLGFKLMQNYAEKDPIVFSVGPLNGFFPFASKTSVIINDAGVIEDLYFGGSLSLRIRFAGIDSIVLHGRSSDETILDISGSGVSFKTPETDMGSLGLPGRRSIITTDNKKILLDNYFTTKENFLEKKFADKRIVGAVVTGTETFTPDNFEKYDELRSKILAKKDEMLVTVGQKPSCANCPMGCEKSKEGELGGNILIHSLVACKYAERIYSDIGVAFSCLNVLGYDYTHEDIENLPKLVEDTLKDIL